MEYIGQYIDLQETNGELFGLSPFKSEKTASFSVTPGNGLFFDFSSGKGGNVLTFIQKYNNCSFHTAVEILKKYANVSEEYVDTRLNATKTIKKYKPVLYNKCKGNEHKILPSDTMAKYEEDNTKLQIWIKEGISSEIMHKYTVKYDPFSNRIVFPIKDNMGNIISVKGRTLDPDFKEKKIRKYTYFQSIEDVDFLFGYYEHLEDIKKQREVILFEGEKSVMLAESWGIKNTAAILTSHLNPLQLPILIKLGVRVVFALDKDIDIRMDENIQKLKHYVKVKYIKDDNNLLEEKDSPVDKGTEIWNTLYEGRNSLN